MPRIIGPALLIFCFSIQMNAAQRSDLPPLPALASNCGLLVELVSLQEEALFLRCEDIKFRVYYPNNLLGHVRILTAEAALTFVRFFTSRRTFHLVGLDGDVEVRAKGDPIAADVFSATKTVPKGFPVNVLEYADSLEGRVFLIQRYVVGLDQIIYRVKERVTEGGNYALTERVAVRHDAQKLGIVHIGRH